MRLASLIVHFYTRLGFVVRCRTKRRDFEARDLQIVEKAARAGSEFQFLRVRKPHSPSGYPVHSCVRRTATYACYIFRVECVS